MYGYIIRKTPKRKSASYVQAVGSIQRMSGDNTNTNANNRMRGNKKRTGSSKQKV